MLKKLTLLLALTTLPLSAHADPTAVVKPGGKPGAALKWSTKGDTTTLQLAEDYDAEEAAKTICKAIKGATCKAAGDKLTIKGPAEAALLKALEKVELEPSLDDVDAMLSAMQSPGGDEDDSGSSIRASKATDFSAVIGQQQELITAKVIKVRRARFPLVFLTVQVTKAPKGIKGIKRGKRIKVLPRVKSRGGIVDPKDELSKLNVGAWYAKKGDRLRMRLESPKKGQDVWIGAAVERTK